MALIIELPHVGESVVEGTIGKWLKKPGDQIQRYDPLVEIVTDKVTMEMPSPVSGVLSRIIAEEGQTIPMGAPIAEFETDESPSPSETKLSPEPESAAPSVGTTGYLVKNLAPVGPTGGGPDGEPTISDTPTPAPARTDSPVTRNQRQSSNTQRLSPAVRRLAQENNIDVNTIQGTGVGGRITRDDVMASISVPEATSAVNPSSLVNNEDTILKITPIRKMIAEAMVRSVSQIPHAWSAIETDVSSLVGVRSAHRQNFIEKEAVELTYLPFIIKMVVESLRENPTLNATWGGDTIILKNRLNIGVAMAGPEGLIVPVIKDADKLSIVGLAHALSDLTFKVKNRKLNVEDVQDGTFTVNNTGVLGSISSQPIINYPQAAILTTEAIQKKPIVVGDGIAIRSIMNLCMSFDHRINDGAESSSFLQSIKRRIESINLDTPVY